MITNTEVKITEINIKKFGKLENLVLNAEDGLNVIYGKNESGKSTIQLFLKAMFYGLSARKRSGDALKERERAIPWGEKRADGVLKLKVGNRSLEIRRSFGKTAASDKTQVIDSVTGQNVSELDVDKIGEILLGISAEVFEKTLFIRQNGVYMGGRDDELSKRMVNLQSTGDEMVSAASAIEKIEAEKRKLKAKDGRSAKGKIDVLRERLEECRRERYELSTQLAQTENERERLSAAKAGLEKVKNEAELLEKEYQICVEQERTKGIRERLSHIDDGDKKLNLIYNSTEYKRSQELTETIVEDAYELEKELEEVRRKSVEDIDDKEEKKCLSRQQRASVVLGGGVAIGLICMIMTALFVLVLKNNIFGIIFGMLTVCGGVLAISQAKVIGRCKDILQGLQEQSKRISQMKLRQQEEEDAISKRLDLILKRFEAKDATELSRLNAARLGFEERIKSIKSARTDFLGDDTYEELKVIAQKAQSGGCRPLAEVDELLKKNRARQLELVAEIEALESKMAYEVSIKKIPSDIDTEIGTINDEISDCERRQKVLEMAMSAIVEAGESWKSETMPRLNRKVNDALSVLTDCKYDDVRVSEDYRLKVDTNGEMYDAEYFSVGTYEQMYLALRLSAAEMITDVRLLFLDDILTQYDDERAQLALKLFEKLLPDWQIFLFTCHSKDSENAMKLGAHIINI